MPSPNFADFDGDGDLDLICGEFLDGFTYFENVGTRNATRGMPPAGALQLDGEPLRMDLQMITPTAIDWDRDGDVDLIVGDEDGRVALSRTRARSVDGCRQFLPPALSSSSRPTNVKFGALATPVGFDWDGDGDEDLSCRQHRRATSGSSRTSAGRSAAMGRAGVSGGRRPDLRIEAGPNGSIQGPCEAKWGYTTLSVADWDRRRAAGHRVQLDLGQSASGTATWAVATSTETRRGRSPSRSQWPGEPPKPPGTGGSPEGNELARSGGPRPW